MTDPLGLALLDALPGATARCAKPLQRWGHAALGATRECPPGVNDALRAQRHAARTRTLHEQLPERRRAHPPMAMKRRRRRG
jgi:hypothetical protein